MTSSGARASTYDRDEDEGRRHLPQMGLKMNEATSWNLNLRTTKVIRQKGNEGPFQMNLDCFRLSLSQIDRFNNKPKMTSQSNKKRSLVQPRIGEEENGGMSATSNAIGTSRVEISKPSCSYVSNLFVLLSVVYDDNSSSNKTKYNTNFVIQNDSDNKRYCLEL